jgi:TPR repeat protein
MATIREQLTAFNTAFCAKHSFKPPEFYYDVEDSKDIYERDIGQLENPIRTSWWYNVTKDDVLATCHKSLATFFIARLNHRGTAEAQRIYWLGKAYENGAGVEKDTQVAFSHYLTAAELGNADAQIEVGFALMSGRCGLIDEKKAFDWFLEAAVAGHPRGAYYTGLCYARGAGVQMNETMSDMYFQFAAAAGDEDAKHIISIEEDVSAPIHVPVPEAALEEGAAGSDNNSETEDEKSVFAPLQVSRRLLRKFKKMMKENPSERMMELLQSAIDLHRETVESTSEAVDARLAVIDKQIHAHDNEEGENFYS